MGNGLIKRILRQWRVAHDTARACPKSGSCTGFLLESMEARVLFSADTAGALNLAAEMTRENVVQPAAIEMSLYESSSSLASIGNGSSQSDEVRIELVFVDAGVEDYEGLLAGLVSQEDAGRQFEVHVLDGQRDGVEQISEILAGHSDIDAVHIISHGNEAEVHLGNATLDVTSLDTYSDAIGGWGDALDINADLLFYGCDLAADAEGRSLVNALGRLTGADVVASNDLTGNARLGGDWDLEFATGDIEAAVAFSMEAQQNWGGVLANNAPTGSVTIDNTTPAQGDMLTASNTLADADGLSGGISYQWQSGGIDIVGATANTYTTVQADVGAIITVVASYIDDLGTPESVPSADTTAVANVNDDPTGSVTIDNTTPVQGDMLTASNTLADADGLTGPINYQWQRGGLNIIGATAATYTIVLADVGAVITVVASYTDDLGTPESVDRKSVV